MSIDNEISNIARAEVAKALRAAANAIEGRPAAVGPAVEVRSSDHFPIPTIAVVKPKRQSKPKPARHAMRDANGTVWSGHGRKPTGFDDSTAVSMVALAV